MILVRHCLIFVALMAGVLRGASAQSPATPLDGEPFTATFAGFDSQQNLKLKVGDKLRIMPATELLRYGNWNDVATGPQLILASGGIVRADVLQLTPEHWIIGDASELGSVLWGESRLPLEAVLGILWQPPADSLARDRLRLKLMALPAGDDQIVLAGGETLSGTLLSAPPAGRFTAEMSKSELEAADVFQLQLPKSDKPLTIAASKVIAVRCGAASFATPAAAFARLGFGEGTCVLAARLEVANNQHLLHLPGGGTLVANRDFGDGAADWFWRQVTLLEPRNARCVYVSELEPLGYKHIPFLAGEWQPGIDRNVLGGALRTKEACYFRGLGQFPASRLAYQLDGKYRRLRGKLALDALAGDRGSVTFRVLTEDDSGTWSKVFESPVIRGGDEPLDLSLDIRGAQRLALLVEFADRGDQCDYANWLDLQLIK